MGNIVKENKELKTKKEIQAIKKDECVGCNTLPEYKKCRKLKELSDNQKTLRAYAEWAKEKVEEFGDNPTLHQLQIMYNTVQELADEVVVIEVE